LNSHNDLLPWNRLVVLLLDFVPSQGAAHCPHNHSHIAAGPPTDQATQAEARDATNHRADTAVMIALNLHIRDLLDNTATNFGFTRLRTNGGASKQHAY
jgi:hypothetical protein